MTTSTDERRALIATALINRGLGSQQAGVWATQMLLELKAAGMVLVPREATTGIIHAVASQLDHPNVFMGGPSPGAKIRAERVYSAMIAAATEADNDPL